MHDGIRVNVYSYIESVGKNFLVGFGCPAEQAVLGYAGYMIQARSHLTRKQVIGHVIIVHNLAPIGGAGHIRHEDTRLRWQHQIEVAIGSRDKIDPVLSPHDGGDLCQLSRLNAGLNYGCINGILFCMIMQNLPCHYDAGKNHQRQADERHPTAIHAF